MKRSDIKRRPLADTVLATLEPGASTYRELDSNGLYFRVKPNGQKSWELRYKKADGKWSWLGMGGYPEVSGALARQKATKLRDSTAKDGSPLETKRAIRAAEIEAANNTFEHLAREWLAIKRKTWTEGTAVRTIGALEKHVFPVFGKRAYMSILPKEWMDFLQGMEQTGIVEQTSRVRGMCKEIYDFACATRRAPHNPLEGLHKFLLTKPVENFAHVSADELPALLRAIRAYPHATDVRIGLQLLSMLACRPTELREASWKEFDLDGGSWLIPAARMKRRREHLVPLPHQATLEGDMDLQGILGIDDVTIMRFEYWDYMTAETIAALFPDGYPGMELEHAALIETSLMLHYRPDLVDMARLPDEAPGDFPTYDLFPATRAGVPPSGALSPPNRATAAYGARIAADCVAGIRRDIADVFG